ncbi:sensor histidine kinase [Aporhodopirellula aestuarii]|uniref:histidine kinase n=1 Tax=Aporhodopirellula aestuarii TaxID=2950107 RepID=A0ABT0U2M1_9BACT|nr:ATP-binding protein [Aporhodopirellula aestuarii]MCM2371146.1 ATP-binding protein [Aporhodopirellula aestuarii]
MIPSLQTVELFLFGFASVVDIALLLVIFDRVNRENTAVWLKSLVASTALIHSGIFFRLMIDDASTLAATPVDRVLVVLICVGLLALPSAMLHAALRLKQTGILAKPPLDRRYALLYLPLLVLPPITVQVWQSQEVDFISLVGSWKSAFLIWLVFANSASILGFLRSRGKYTASGGDLFLSRLSLILAFITLSAIIYVAFAVDTAYEAPCRLLTTLSPLGAALLFVWHSLRGRLLPLIMERTVGYAVIFVGIMLLHRLAIVPLVRSMGAKTNVDFFWIEGMMIAAVVLCIPTLRRRVGESLRYLLSTNVNQVRDEMRGLTLRLAQNGSNDRAELLRWFATDLRRCLDLDYVTITLNGDAAISDDIKPEAIAIRADTGSTSSSETQLTDRQRLIHNSVSDHVRIAERGTLESQKLEQAFTEEDALMAVRLSFGSTCGSVVLGNRLRNDRLTSDQIVVLALVIDQFAATLHHRHEQNILQQTQRKVLHQEKLSVLGLLSGSLAHELRNPLSSIRTITTLAMEDLGPSHESVSDLRMVVEEIDRLTQTTNQLLDFAKPDQQRSALVEIDPIINRIVCILRHLAKQYGVELTIQLDCPEIKIASTESSFSEIVLNLTKNAIEAAREVADGKVTVSSKTDEQHLVVAVCDNGPGIPVESETELYQPFVTAKSDGNGLGLFVVAERVKEIGGTITYHPNEPCGALFELRVPIHSVDSTSER